jgi:hypothetical protein
MRRRLELPARRAAGGRNTDQHEAAGLLWAAHAGFGRRPAQPGDGARPASAPTREPLRGAPGSEAPAGHELLPREILPLLWGHPRGDPHGAVEGNHGNLPPGGYGNRVFLLRRLRACRGVACRRQATALSRTVASVDRPRAPGHGIRIPGVPAEQQLDVLRGADRRGLFLPHGGRRPGGPGASGREAVPVERLAGRRKPRARPGGRGAPQLRRGRPASCRRRPSGPGSRYTTTCASATRRSSGSITPFPASTSARCASWGPTNSRATCGCT